jgi:DNA adenine methylase
MSDIRDLWDDLDGFKTKKRNEMLKPPVAYPGSKTQHLEQLLEILPLYNTYVEPFGGSAALLLARPRANLEVYNDAYAGVSEFWKVVQDDDLLEEMLAACDMFLHSREQFAEQLIIVHQGSTIVERAAAWFYTTKTSFAGLGRNWGREVSGKAATFTKYRKALRHMGPLKRRMSNVQIENTDYKNIFRDFDSPDAVFFIDPPYLGDYGGTYKNEEVNHEVLLEMVFDMRSYCAVCGRPSKLYDNQAWDEEHTFERMTAVAGRTHNSGKKIRGIEKVWVKNAS